MTYVYSPRGDVGVPFDNARCAASVMSNYRSHQCKSKASLHECRKLGPFDEPDSKVYGWCKTHAPSTEAAKSAARNAKWDAERRASERARQVASLRNSIADAVLADVGACPPAVEKLARKLLALTKETP